MFCINCGTELPDKAKFCFNCGEKTDGIMDNSDSRDNKADRNREVNDNLERKYVSGTVAKCPGCGEIINEMIAVCPICGIYISRSNANQSVSMFKSELMEIEKCRKTKSDVEREMREGAKNIFEKALVGIQINAGEIEGNDEKIARQKIELVKNFPIPNDVEEVSEFILLAVANIDVKLSKKSLKNVIGSRNDNWEKDLSDAWVSKMEQMYKKAEFSFAGDTAYEKIKKVYFDKMKELNYIKE